MSAFDPKVLEEVCPDWKKDHWDSFTEEDKTKWLTLRDRARSDWFFLANDLLGYDFQEDVHADLFAQFPQFDPQSNKHFYELSEVIKKMMILWSRGTFKSTAVVVFAIACLLNDPDLVILIISGSEKLAKGLIKEVKSHFERPYEKFESLFPEYCRKKLGNITEFTLECRRDHHKRMPSMLISSSKSAKSGLHPDLTLVDDIVNETNYRSPELLEKCWEDYQLLEPLLNPGGYTIVTGTRYSFGDTYERIQKQAIEEEKELGKTVWKFSFRTCWKDDSEAEGPLFTPRLTKRGKTVGNSLDYLHRMKISLGDELFACQYLNNPIPGAAKSFTPDLLDRQTFHWLSKPDPSFTGPVLPPQGPVFVVGDLAYVGDAKRDSTVFYVCRIWNGQIWVFHCLAGKWNTEQVTNTLWNEIIGVFRPVVVFIEKTPAYESYDHSFRSFMMTRNIQRYPVSWYKQPGYNLNGAKSTRVAGLQGPMSQGRLWLYAGMTDYDKLREQLEKFPKFGKHDDYADALGFACIVPTGWQMTNVAQVNPIPSFLRDTPDPELTPETSGTGSVILCG